MLSTRPLSLCLWAAIAVCKTEAGLIDNYYPVPQNNASPNSPFNFATIASLDLDMRSINAYLAVANSQNELDIAKKVFEEGAFSDASALLMILDPTGKYATSETNIVPGSTVVGKTVSGGEITGIAKYGKTETLNGSEGSENILQVHYPAVALEDTNNGCFVGGNPTPITDGCFAPSGTITITSESDTFYTFQYSYQPNYDNVNGLSLSSMDLLRGQVVNTSPPETLTKFLNYYGDTFYDHAWIEAAFGGISTSGSNGVMDFSTFGFEERSSAIRTGIVAIRIWLFVLNAIDDAVAECGQSFGEQLGLKRWDHAVAAYSGSIPVQTEITDFSLGYFLFTMAQTQCKYFGTCDADVLGGMAKVNQQVLETFRQGRTEMVSGDCDGIKLSAQKLRSLLTVPLLQGLLRSVHDIDQKDVKDGNRGEAAAYAAALLPLLHDCSAGYAFSVYDNVRPGRIETVSFEVLKDALEQNYQCLGVTCEDIGGLLNYGGVGYVPGAEPCGEPTPATSPVEQPSPFINSYADDDNNSFEGNVGGSSNFDVEDDDFQISPKRQFRNADAKQALLIGLFSGLGVLAAIISITVGYIDTKRAKEFDTNTNAPNTKSSVNGLEQEDVIISSEVV